VWKSHTTCLCVPPVRSTDVKIDIGVVFVLSLLYTIIETISFKYLLKQGTSFSGCALGFIVYPNSRNISHLPVSMAGDAIQIPMPKIATATTQNTIQGVADFMNGDEDFIIFRKFRHLHIELLLKLQTELGEANSVLLDDEEDRRGVARALLEYSKSDSQF
jgi:hypothetical protein